MTTSPDTPSKALTFTTKSAAETVCLGRAVGALLQKGDVIAFCGTLGAGKTTMTKGIAKALGVEDTVTSPTFCLVSEYSGAMPFYHIDAYRLRGEDDFESIGADDMLYGHGVCAVEWSENVCAALPSRAIQITITAHPNGYRTVEILNWPYGKIDYSLTGEVTPLGSTNAMQGKATQTPPAKAGLTANAVLHKEASL